MSYPARIAAWTTALLLVCATALAGSPQATTRSAASPSDAAAQPTPARSKAASRATRPAAVKPSPAARARKARQVSDAIRLRSDQVHRWLRAARLSRQHQRGRCLDDLLSQAHAVERLADQSQRAMLGASRRHDGHRLRRESSRLRVYETRSQVLIRKAQACGKPAARAHRRGQNVHEVRTRRPRLPGDSARYPSSSATRSKSRWQ